MLIQRLREPSFFSSRRDLDLIQRQFNKLLSMTESDSSGEFPLLNVWTSEQGAIARTELPGFDPSDVDVTLVNDTLTIKGSRKIESCEEDGAYLRQERVHGAFSRSIKLPFSVEAERVDARFFDGVLEITLPRAEREKAKKINVVSE